VGKLTGFVYEFSFKLQKLFTCAASLSRMVRQNVHIVLLLVVL